MSRAGEINLAPYSFFNGVSSRPAIVMFSSEGQKDSFAFIRETGEFVCNLATWDLRDAMNRTSAPMARGVNEMKEAGARGSAVAHRQAATRRGITLRARMRAAADRAAGRYRGSTNSIRMWYSVR